MDSDLVPSSSFPVNEQSGFELWPETLFCVFEQDTLLSPCLSPPRSINGYRQIVGDT